MDPLDFTTAVTKANYHSSLWESIITFIITLIAAILTTITFLHTGYKFYGEDISHILEDDNIRAGNGLSPTSVSPSKSRKKKSRSSLPKKSKSYHPAPHHKEIHATISLFTVLYLLSGASYTIAQTIVLLLEIFTNVDVDCYVFEYLQILLALWRSMLYLLFLSRLYLTFEGSDLAYPGILLSVLGCGILFANFGAVTYWIINVSEQIDDNHGCSSIKYVIPASITITIDTIINIVLLYLFVHKLSILIKIQTSTYDLVANIRDSQALGRVKDLIKLMTKLTVLACVAVITSWLTTAIFVLWLPQAVSMFDIVIGTFCILFCYEFHSHRYLIYCFLPRQLCYHVCFWWFISGDYLCKKEDSGTTGFEGGCCDVLCVCCKYDDDKHAKMDDKEQILIYDENINNDEDDPFSPTPKQSDSIPDNKYHKDSNTLTVDSNNNNNTLTVDGKDDNDDGDGGDVSIKKNPLGSILRGDTEEFSKTNTQTTTMTIAGHTLLQPNPYQDMKRNNVNLFSHRAYTLKKIQHLLYEDEEIDSSMRFTLRSSRRAHTLRSMRSVSAHNALAKHLSNDIIQESTEMEPDPTIVDNQQNEKQENDKTNENEENNQRKPSIQDVANKIGFVE